MSAILIGDENRKFLEELSQMLTAEEYRVHTTTKACEVLNRLLSQPIAVLILGTRLEGIDSPDLLPIIKQIDESLPIIVIGERPSLRTERQVRTYQIFYYLVKPVDPQELLTVIRQALLKPKRPHVRRYGFHTPAFSTVDDSKGFGRTQEP